MFTNHKCKVIASLHSCNLYAIILVMKPKGAIDPYEELLQAIIIQALKDFANYPHDMSIRLPAFVFLQSGGGYWADSLDSDFVKRLLVTYCKENYYERNTHHPDK